MGINSRAKGSRTERTVCEVLHKWTGRKFAKVPASGGLHWNISQACGDVICLAEKHKFPFAVEVKGYEKIDFSHLLTDNKNKKIIEFWEQSVRDSQEAKKIPLLLMRYNGLPKNFFFVVLDLKTTQKFPHTITTYCSNRLVFKSSSHNLVILRSDEFFQIPYKELKYEIAQSNK